MVVDGLTLGGGCVSLGCVGWLSWEMFARGIVGGVLVGDGFGFGREVNWNGFHGLRSA